MESVDRAEICSNLNNLLNQIFYYIEHYIIFLPISWIFKNLEWFIFLLSWTFKLVIECKKYL